MSKQRSLKMIFRLRGCGAVVKKQVRQCVKRSGAPETYKS